MPFWLLKYQWKTASSVWSHVEKMGLEYKILLNKNCVTNIVFLQISVIDKLPPSIVTISQPPIDQAIRIM